MVSNASKVEQIATALDALTAKIVKKQVKPNSISKQEVQPPKQDIEEHKSKQPQGGAAEKSGVTKKPRKPKIVSQKASCSKNSPLKPAKVARRNDSADDIDSDISSDSGQQRPLKYQQSMKLVAQPVAGMLSVTSDSSLSRDDFKNQQ